jgi:hydroxymethylglutaryl-CoA reductase (NADPH)
MVESMRRETRNEEVKKESNRLLSLIKQETGIDVLGIVQNDDFSEITGRCCENILGYKKIPLGVSNRSIIVNDERFWIPVCTTEGALVASMCRGIKLVNLCGGVQGVVENLGVTRSFAVKFNSFKDAVVFYKWIKRKENVYELKIRGNSTSRHLKIKSIKSKHVVGDKVFIKVYAFTGDAMGMNMITKACSEIAKEILQRFTGSELVCVSANICTDKKWSAENYCSGRGRRVFLNVIIRNEMCKSILKVGIDELYRVYYTKVVLGSALVMGGFNCQASNYVSSIFIAMGQDPGQAIESSNCILGMEKTSEDELSVSLWMPSLVVGTLGGGTHLEPAKSFIKQFYREDSDCVITDRTLDAGIAPSYLALTIASAVLCGELSLLGAMANNTLMDAHLSLNRRE